VESLGGEMSDILLIALKQRCHNDGLGGDKETLANQFRLHLHRGIGYLAGDPISKNRRLNSYCPTASNLIN
jgi:DNA sulfur modification protein DndE